MTDQPLSPATQAVMDAFSIYPLRADHIAEDLVSALAAALRSAADQVAPEDFDYWDGRTGEYGAGCETGQNERNAHVRKELLAIAAELEAQ